MSVMNGQQFQCANTTCLPFITRTVSTVRRCQMACLADNRCQAISFYQSSSICELFDNRPDQNGIMLSNGDVVSMTVISGTRVPAEQTTTTTSTTTASITTTIITTTIDTTTAITTTIPTTTTMTTITTAVTTMAITTSSTTTAIITSITTTTTTTTITTTTTTAIITSTTTTTATPTATPTATTTTTSTTSTTTTTMTTTITATTTTTSTTTTATSTTTTATTSSTTTTTTTRTTTTRTTTTTTASVNPCSTGVYWNVNGVRVAGTGTADSGLNELNCPYGIYLDSNNSLYIVDSYNYRVMKYLYGASSGTVVAGKTGLYGTGLSRLSSWPTTVYVDSSRNLYIADTENARIMRWADGASSGTMVAGSGSNGSAFDEFGNAEGVWIDSNLNVFVSERDNHRVTKWASGASSGVVVAGITGSPGKNNSVYRIPLSVRISNTLNKLYSPLGIFYDEIDEDLYIVNLDGHTVMRWNIASSYGTVVAGVLGASGSSASRLNRPWGVTLDQWKNIYVADYNNNRIQLFCNGSTTGITIAGSDTGGSSVSGPAEVRLDSEMNLYVSEYDGHRVKKFYKL